MRKHAFVTLILAALLTQAACVTPKEAAEHGEVETRG